MAKILFVRELTSSEIKALENGQSSNNIFTMRRCKIILASAEKKKPSQIATKLDCSTQTVRRAIHAFNRYGLKCTHKKILSKKTYSVSELIKKGNKQKRKGKLSRAITTYRQAIALYPTSAWSYYYLGEALTQQCKIDEAIACYQKAIEHNPGTSEHYNKLGEIYFKQRQLDKAVNYFKQAIALYPNSAWYHQNLGEALAQQHKWGAAVNCYRHALKLNPDEVFEYHNALEIEPDDSKLIEVPDPVFIIGCGHSGTSIMLAILGNHPSFYPITFESAIFKRSEPEIREIMLKWDSECIEAGKKRWIEKTPPHIFHIKKFLLHRPQSKFILMLRDGRDVVCSLKHRQQFKTFESRVERWIYDNLAGLPYWNHPQVKVIRYEDIIANTHKTIKNVFSFLGEKYTDQVFNYYLNTKHWYSSKITEPESIKTHEDHLNLRNWQINQPLFDGRNKWKTEMSQTEKKIFKKNAQKYLVEFGYANDSNW